MLRRFRRHQEPAKVVVIGLDCAEPSLIFDRWRDDLPNLRALMDRGIWGPLESVNPPITVPAWSCMMSGRDPGELGIYGFRNRVDYSYDRMAIATSAFVREPRVWDVLSRAGKQVAVVGVPGTDPPTPVNGVLIGSFLTPSTDETFTYPANFRKEVLRWSDGGYMLDVRDFRTSDRAWLLDQIYVMTDKRFTVAEHIVTELPWDFFMMVEMGTDRIHHAFWRYHAQDHRLYEPGNPFEDAIHDYYRYLDTRIGQLLQLVPDDTAVFVVSDHGAKTMQGGICVNDWLRQQGYLTLSEEPAGVTPFADAKVDWGTTRAWGEGGYYARICLNVKDRESQGCVAADQYEELRQELKVGLEGITDEDGRPLGTKVYLPQDIYRSVHGIAPDLIVHFGDLAWRSIGSIGHPLIQTRENDTGLDDANHAQFGTCIYANPNLQAHGCRDGLHLFDIGKTILRLFDVSAPEGMRGNVIGD
ncbi:MAG TPA: alkaline phosphatase family protein [Gemmatimonadaceae bacterium]|nr:alkaline phosphatase family protein [Gemmatimonadaceae bacterium]